MNTRGLQNRPSVGLRIATGILFLGILGVCGYVGVRRESRPAVGAPISYAVMAQGDASYYNEAMEDVSRRLDEERRQEIELLDSVIEHPDTDKATRENALAQKVQIANRMEIEAQIEAVLLEMGIHAQAVSGEAGVSIVASAQDMPDEQAQLRAIHAASVQTEIDASKLKIILVKK